MEGVQLIVIIEIDRWGTVIPLRGVVSQPLLFTVDGSRFTECLLFVRKLSTVNRQLFLAIEGGQIGEREEKVVHTDESMMRQPETGDHL